MKKLNNKELIKKFDTLYFYDNNHTEKYILNNSVKSTKRILKIITIKALQIELDYFHKNTFEYFLANNLPENSNKKTTLAVLLKCRTEEEKISYYVFNNSKKDIDNDIPFFHKDAPDGYSYFCCKNEFSQLTSFLKRNKKIKKQQKSVQEKLELEPLPNKKHYICQICKIKFDNYLEHIHSRFHEQSKFNLKEQFLKIKTTFKRIVTFNKEKKEKNGKNGVGESNEKKEKNEKNGLRDEKEKEEKFIIISYKRKTYIDDESKEKKANGKEEISSNIISENIQNNTTKCESSLRENIHMNNKKKRNKARSVIYNVNSSKKKEKKDDMDISPNNILDILDTIHCRSVNQFSHLKKRKKNDIHKSIFHDNYIFEIQKVSKKIAYYNSFFN